MRTPDIVRYAIRALAGYRMRTGLMLLAMAIGVGSVVVLTGLGESARRYVSDQFSALGTNLLIVIPGRNETTGGAPPLAGATPRDLTLGDAAALTRSRAVTSVAPLAVGQAPVSHGPLSRDVSVLGTTHAYGGIRELDIPQGRFLPAMEAERAAQVAVIGGDIRRELFPATRAVGEWIRVGDRRFRVIGVISQRGQSLGVDMDEVVIVPVASAQALFDTPSLFRIFVKARSRGEIPRAQSDVEAIIRERHEGELDVTVITQDAMLSGFDSILQTLTLAVAGIAGVSLLVAGILIMNVMLIAVSQRTAEIGLLRALGATRRRVLVLFLGEAVLLAALGAVLGLVIGGVGTWAIQLAYPVLSTQPPAWSLASASGIALLTGLVFAWLPARRAARLDPVAALTGH